MQYKSYVGRDYWLSYCDYVKDNPLYQVDYNTFRAIIDDYFRYLRDEIIERGKEVKLPCRLGTLQIVKHRPKQWNNKSLRIDYGESKKYGKMLFHLNEHSNGFKYRFYWNKHNMILTNKIKYQIVMTRDNKRRLAQIIKNREHDYVEI